MDGDSPWFAGDTDPNWIVVRHVNWKVCDSDEIEDFFKKFGSVKQVKKEGRLTYVSFEDQEGFLNVTEASSEELVYKKQQFCVMNPRIRSIIRLCNHDKLPLSEPECLGDDWTFSEVQQDENHTSIHELPNEVLDYVFTFLDIKQRFRTELVCKRWRWLGKCQLWSGPKRLAFNPDDVNQAPMSGRWQLTDAILSAILARCGPMLRALTISKQRNNNSFYQLKREKVFKVSVSSKSLEIIGKYCCSLRTIILKEIPVTQLGLRLVSQGCPKLKTFALFNCMDLCKGVSLARFLKRCEALEYLYLLNCYEGNNFANVNRNLKAFCVQGPTDSIALQHITSRCDCLEELCFSCSPDMITSQLILNALHHFSPTLKILDLTDNLRGILDWRKILPPLKNLEMLNLRYSSGKALVHRNHPCPALSCKNLKQLYFVSSLVLVDELLVKGLLASTDNLETLNFGPCFTGFPEVLIFCLKHPENLKTVVFRKVDVFIPLETWFKVIGAMTNLEYMSFDGFSDELVPILVNSCAKLKVLKSTYNRYGALTTISDYGLTLLSVLPSLTTVDIKFNVGVVTQVGIEALARHGRLEEFHISDGNDESCGLFASYCPNFRVLGVIGVKNITNVLVETYSIALTRGFLKCVVVLFICMTSVTKNVKKHDRLELVF